MKKWSLMVIITMICFGMISGTASALPARVVVSFTTYEGVDGGTSDVHLTWQYTEGDKLFKSTDGNHWTEVLFPAATTGQTVKVTGATGVANYSLIYFEVRDAKLQAKRVNAFPPTPNAHANYEDNTDTCKGCHSTHTATQAALLLETTVEALCNSCHGAATTKSRYSVVDGAVKKKDGTWGKALGGPFTGGPATPWGKNATSAHSVNASQKVAPGGVSGSNTYQLTCTSCHTGHANNNNYRLTKSLDTAKTPINAYAVNVDGNGDNNPNGFAEDYNYLTGLNEYCSACHTNYQRIGETTNTNGTINYGAGSTADGQGYYRHPTKVDLTYTLATTGETQQLTSNLPLGNENGKTVMVCSTCHYAHGTVVVGDNPSQYDVNGDTFVDINDTSTMMKRLDYMGVCEECHKK